MFHGSRSKKRVDKDQKKNDVQKSDTAIPADGNELPIDIHDLNRSFRESMNVGGMTDQSAAVSSDENCDEENRLLADEVDNTYRGLSDIDENSVLRDSIELNDILSDNLLAALGPEKAVKKKQNKMTSTDSSPPSKRQSESGASSDSKHAGSDRVMNATAAGGKQASSSAAGGSEPVRESARESAARKRAQLKLLSEESVAAKRAKAMAKFQEKVPCVSDNCRSRGSFESEEQELDRLIAAEEERDAEMRKRPNKCIGFLRRDFDKAAFKPSLYMNLYKEPVTIRRTRRMPAQPAAAKKEAKPNKTSDLRYKYLHNQKFVSSGAAEHLKKFKRPPFKNPSQFGHSCNDPPARFGEEREDRKLKRVLKKTRESREQMLNKK